MDGYWEADQSTTDMHTESQKYQDRGSLFRSSKRQTQRNDIKPHTALNNFQIYTLRTAG